MNKNLTPTFEKEITTNKIVQIEKYTQTRIYENKK
jgi:hypothetical protein